MSSGFDPNGMASYQEAAGGEVVPSSGGAVEAYGGQLEPHAGDGKGAKGGLSTTEKLWLFGENKPLSVQSYGSLPTEARSPRTSAGALCS
jgi:hypothetical protein